MTRRGDRFYYTYQIICAKEVQTNVIGGMLIPTDNISLFLSYDYILGSWIALRMIGIDIGTYYLKKRK